MSRRDQLGAKIGPRVARVVVDAQLDHLSRSSHTRAKTEAEAKHIFWRDIARERDAHVSPLLDELLGHEGTHPDVERVLRFMHSGHGELAGMLAMRSASLAVGQGVSSGIADWLAPINQRMMQSHPNLALDPTTAAAAVVGRILGNEAGTAEAARNGVNSSRFGHLLELAQTHPDLALALELWRRGLVNEGEVTFDLARQGYSDQRIEAMRALRRVILSPPDLALMRLRGIIDDQEGADIAALSGVDRADFERLVLATGEPPGLEQLQEAYRRGFIDKERLDRGIKQSRVRDEWTDVVERLRFGPMPTADAVEAVVRNIIPDREGRAIAEQNGLELAQWPALVAAHGRPPGLGQMQTLLNRGLVSQAEVDQAVRESDIKDKYVPKVRGLRYRIPGERAIVMLLKDGTISSTRAHDLLLKEGYEPDIAGAILHAGTSQRTERHKHASEAQIVELFEDHAIDEARARSMLTSLGYPAEDVALILRLADLRRERKWRDQVIGAVRSSYLKRHIDANEARGELSASGLPAGQVGYLLGLWAIELRGQRRQLSEAQIIHAHRFGALSRADTEVRLRGLGYSDADAGLLVATAGPLPKGR